MGGKGVWHLIHSLALEDLTAKQNLSRNLNQVRVASHVYMQKVIVGEETLGKNMAAM